MQLILFSMLQPMPKPRKSTRSACSVGGSGDSYSYSFGSDEGLCVESRLAPYYLKMPRPEWKIISYRKQEKELIRNYEYMPNRLQCGVRFIGTI